MKTIQSLRVSVVIPVYNEEDQLDACLQALAAQTVAPFEVIVVDNNSTDTTALVASRYPFVTLIKEYRQGVVFARDCGFNRSRGDIIGRIDADSVVAPNWIETVQHIFMTQPVDAITGRVGYHDMGLRVLCDRIDLYFRRRIARLLGPEIALQGANMAIRRSTWKAVSGSLCHSAGLHEDFDLAIHTNKLGFHVVFDESLRASIGYRQASYNFVAFCRYGNTSPRTYARHGLSSYRHMYPILAFVICMYIPITLLSRGYSRKLGRFSFTKALRVASPPRVNPAYFIE